MIPVRLYVRNFMCYRGEGETLDLEAVHLACLAGENGAGKSALLSAITWALWGKARERVSDDDQVMSLGATDMEVQFEFVLGEARYLVIRKRARKGSKSFPILELHVRTDADGDTWKPLTGHNVTDTEARITKLLKMDYDTFINSSFILQGRADSFTIKNPGERKEVLAKILGLEQYDRLDEQAREEARERKAQMAEIEVNLRRIEFDLALREGYEERLAEVEADLVARQHEHDALDAEIRALQAQVDAMKVVENRVRELDARIETREARMNQARGYILSKSVEKARLEELLAQREEIESEYTRLQAARAAVDGHEARLAQQADLQEELSAAVSLVERAKAGLESDIRNVDGRIREYDKDLAGRHDAERQLAIVLVDHERLESLSAEHEDDKCTLETLKVKMRTLTDLKENCRKEGIALRQKIDMILTAHAEKEGRAPCPLCGTALEAEALQRVQDSYDRDITAKRQEYEATSQELEGINKEIVALELRIAKQREGLKGLPDLLKRRARYEQILKRLDEEEELRAAARKELEALKGKLKLEDFAGESRQQAAAIRARMKDLAYNKEAHTADRAVLSGLLEKGYESLYHQLQNAGSTLPGILADLEVHNANLKDLQCEQESDRMKRQEIAPQAEQLAEVQDQLTGKQAAGGELKEKLHGLRGEKGGLKRDIERCNKLEIEKAQLARQCKAAEDEKRIYDDLSSAFGKKGIQAMIIENVIPEIEEEANTLLGRMTDGRMSVQFATQRDAKTTKSVIETLDINISDEMGTRPYEMYSGGEAYRANFAVRIALSKLLARRAGAQLQLLVIDEGFGTQDGLGREKLVSAIHSIQGDFEKILVVTHIEELKGEFPVRIDVEKREGGSRITVN